MIWIAVHPQFDPRMLGFIPAFLNENDPRSAKTQIDQNYRHGGGWLPQPKFKMLPDGNLSYPGDPPLVLLAETRLRDEVIRFYDCSYVGRAAQRSRALDLRTAILDAHRNLLAVRQDPLPHGDVLVRAGPGAFVGQIIYGQELKGGIVIYFRPRTWLHEDQIQDHRVWLTDAGPGHPWVEGPLAPFPLRDLTIVSRKIA